MRSLLAIHGVRNPPISCWRPAPYRCEFSLSPVPINAKGATPLNHPFYIWWGRLEQESALKLSDDDLALQTTLSPLLIQSPVFSLLSENRCLLKRTCNGKKRYTVMKGMAVRHARAPSTGYV